MSCGAEGLLLALKLAGELVQPEQLPGRFTNAITLECNPERCGGTEVEILQFRLAKARAAEEAVKQRNQKVTDFQNMLRMCGVKKDG